MDVDADVDGKLAQQLECLATADRETLVQRLTDIVGEHVTTPEACRILLDMNNWNLQKAVGCFYDYRMADQISIPTMQFIRDITIGEGEGVPPNTSFIKVWNVYNPGPHRWPEGCRLHFLSGERLTEVTSVDVEPLDPECYCDISITMVSPPKNGLYESSWQMQTAAGYPFGDIIWCIVTVEDAGLLALMQMMSNASCNETVMDEPREERAAEFSGTADVAELFSQDNSQFPTGPNWLAMTADSAEANHTVLYENGCVTSYSLNAMSMPISIPTLCNPEESTEFPAVPPCTPSSADDSCIGLYTIDQSSNMGDPDECNMEKFN